MYALVDCNNFYASCERVFNPRLNGRPVVVLSNNDGCIIARSAEAKAMGLKMGEPAFKIGKTLEKNNVAVYSSNFTLYGDMSQRVMDTLSSYAVEMEVYSIDEAFLALPGTFPGPGGIQAYATQIRTETTRNTGIPVSVGVAPTKSLSKVANRFAKKGNGVFVMDSDSIRIKALQNLDIEDVWGIGGQYGKLLRKHRINTAYDFTLVPPLWVQKHLTIMGLRLQRELLGFPCHELELKAPPKKAICTSRSFGKMISDFELVSQSVASFTARCAEKLRKDKTCANIIMVFIHTNPHREELPQYAKSLRVVLPTASNDTMELCHYARIGLKKIFKSGFEYKKAGVMVSEIVPESSVQGNLFDRADRPRQMKCMNSMDIINRKFGRDTLRLGSQGYSNKWKLRQERLSPRYTTDWNQLISVRI